MERKNFHRRDRHEKRNKPGNQHHSQSSSYRIRLQNGIGNFVKSNHHSTERSINTSISYDHICNVEDISNISVPHCAAGFSVSPVVDECSNCRYVYGYSDHHKEHYSISVSWSTIATILVLVFVFHQIIDPFRRRTLEVDNDSPRQQSSLYFYINIAVYGWLLSGMALTIIPQFSEHYNEVIAAALFFPMLFSTIVSLLVGKATVRFIRIFLYRYYHKSYEQDDTDSDSSICSNQKGRLPFYRPFRKVLMQSFCVTVALCFVYADCWSRNLGIFKLHDTGGGAVCSVVFTPFVWMSFLKVIVLPVDSSSSADILKHSLYGIDENAIWIVWLICVLLIILLYIQVEFSFSITYMFTAFMNNCYINMTSKVVQNHQQDSNMKDPTSRDKLFSLKMQRNKSSSSFRDFDSDSDEESFFSWVEGHDQYVSEDESNSNNAVYHYGDIMNSGLCSQSENVDKGENSLDKPKNTLSMVSSEHDETIVTFVIHQFLRSHGTVCYF